MLSTSEWLVFSILVTKNTRAHRGDNDTPRENLRAKHTDFLFLDRGRYRINWQLHNSVAHLSPECPLFSNSHPLAISVVAYPRDIWFCQCTARILCVCIVCPSTDALRRQASVDWEAADAGDDSMGAWVGVWVHALEKCGFVRCQSKMDRYSWCGSAWPWLREVCFVELV